MALSRIPPIDAAVLARESENIRRLARALLFDVHRAEDAAQETMRTALERGPRPGFEPSAWLRGVLRNVVRRTRRTDARRLARERAAAMRRVAPEEASAERLAARKAVIEAVLTLPETLRTAIELRYFEGLPPRAMARRLGVPVDTCRTRVRRGVEALRAELDRREGGGGRRWAWSLAVLVPKSSGALTSLVAGGLLVSAKAKTAAVLLLLVLLGAAAIHFGGLAGVGPRDSDGAPPTVAAPDHEAALARSPTARPAVPVKDGAREAGAIPALRVTGLVTDTEGRPIPGAKIHAGPADAFDDALRAADATTDAAGRFTVSRTGPALAWRIQASAEGRRRASVTASTAGERDVVLRLSRTVPFWLEVRDAKSDRPIEGADVVLITADTGGPRVEGTTTDAFGMASIEDPGVRSIGFESAAMVRVVADGHSAESFSLGSQLSPGVTTKERPHRVALPPAVTTPVKVLGTDGKPASGARLFGWDGSSVGSIAVGTWLQRVPGALPLGPVLTDADGRAAFVLPVQRWYLLAVRGNEVAFRDGAGAPRNPIEMRLEPGITVDGVVVDEQGAPVADVEVHMDWDVRFRTSSEERTVSPPRELEDSFSARSGVDGKFVLRDLPRPPVGKPLLVMTLMGSDMSGSALVDASDGKTAAFVRLELKRFGERWAVRVRSASGAPLGGALVGLLYQFPPARTDADGIAQLMVMPVHATENAMFVEAPGFATSRLSIPATRPAAPIEVVLAPEAVLDAFVRDADGRPAVGAWVTVVVDGSVDEVQAAVRDRGSPRHLAERFTDAEGRAHFDALPRAPVFIDAEVSEAGFAEVKEPNRRIVRLAEPGPVELVLPRAVFDPAKGSAVEGEVVNEDGSPIQGLYTAALQSTRLGQFTAVSTGRRFRFEGIPAGRWQLQIFTFNSDVPLLAEVETQPGRDVTDLRVVRTAPGRISGQVVAPGVSDLSGLPVEALDARGIDHVRGRATTDALGAFRFDSLPAGPYRLRLRAPGYDPFARGSPAATPRRAGLFALEETPVEVRPGVETRVEVRAGPGAHLIVRCDDERLRTRPDKFADGEFNSTEFQTNLALTWPDGHSETAFGLYRGRNDTPWVLAPGRYRLRVLRFGEPSQDVVVDRAGEIEVPVTFEAR